MESQYKVKITFANIGNFQSYPLYFHILKYLFAFAIQKVIIMLARALNVIYKPNYTKQKPDRSGAKSSRECGNINKRLRDVLTLASELNEG
jgi:hypothetical protein